MIYTHALVFMNHGGICGLSGGEYDYYKISEGKLIGYWSCNEDEFPVEYVDNFQPDWYVIK